MATIKVRCWKKRSDTKYVGETNRGKQVALSKMATGSWHLYYNGRWRADLGRKATFDDADRYLLERKDDGLDLETPCGECEECKAGIRCREMSPAECTECGGELEHVSMYCQRSRSTINAIACDTCGWYERCE